MRPRTLFVIVVAVCVATVVGARLNHLSDSFGNNDVIGPVYNAEVILSGGLPYRDTCEAKSPLLFYLFALVFWLFKPSLLYVRAVWGLWHLGACLVVYGVGNRLGSRTVGATAAFLLALYGALCDINYASWLVLPMALALYCYARGELSQRLLWFASAGFFCCVSFLVKKPGGFIVVGVALLAVASAFSDHRRAWLRVSLKRLVAVAAGGLLALTPLVVYFAWRGALPDLVRGLFPPRVLGAVLMAKGQEAGAYLVLKSIGPGIEQMYAKFSLPAAMATLNVLLLVARRRPLGRLARVALVSFFVSFLSVAITGGRFYRHHAIHYLPALVLLAVLPEGIPWLLRWVKERASEWLHRVYVGAAVILAGLAVGTQYWFIATGRRDIYDWVLPETMRDSQKVIGAAVRRSTQPGDTIIAWGWFSWPVYHWAGRRSPSRIYKEMGFLTDVNTNTAWTKSRVMHFRPGPLAEEYLRDVVAKRPSFVILSDWYPYITDGKAEPLWEFKALAEYIRANYRRDWQYDRYVILRRKDLRVVRLTCPRDAGTIAASMKDVQYGRGLRRGD